MAQPVSDAAFHEFSAECEEILVRVSSVLGTLEREKSTGAGWGEVYRDIHTLKGSAFLYGYNKLGGVAHAMEATLEPYRRTEAVLGSALFDALYKCVDLAERILASIKASREEGNFDEEVLRLTMQLFDANLTNLDADYLLVGDAPVVQNDDALSPDEQALAPPPNATPVRVRIPMHSVNETQPVLEGVEIKEVATIRVHVSLLDKLMTLVGEMVLIRNQVIQYANRNEDMDFLKLSQRLNLVTSELQNEVMNTRMQPIGNVLAKFKRVVRDLSKDLNKQIELTLSGTETELDKTLLEAITDPLMHIIRNACDHGLESPEVRAAKGKPETGTLAIRAFHEGGQVIVEIADDGAGIPRDKVLEKAVSRALITAERAQSMSDREVHQLIFLPGFSTAEKITNISGRGVGLDVVKTNVERIGGSVEIQSEFGAGSVFKIRIPLTLAIIPALVVKSGGEIFAIPQVKLVELVRVENDTQQRSIELVESKPVYRLRGNLLPLVVLNEVLGLKSADATEGVIPASANIVVLNAEEHQFGLIVDEIHDSADVVVKPLPLFLKHLALYAGATLMGDGSVALILDVVGLASKAHLSGSASQAAKSFANEKRSKEAKSHVGQEYLLCRLNAPSRYAIPLCLVHRLEEFSAESIEFSGGLRLVQYRGSLLPLIDLNKVLGFDALKSETPKDKVAVVVVQKRDRYFGIQVDDILDVVNVETEIDDFLRDRPGILGNIVVEEEVAVVADVLGILEREIGRMGHGASSPGESDPGLSFDERAQIKVLVVEDTPFFRNLFIKTLSENGYKVTADEDGQNAWQRLQSANRGDFDIVVSDIEMPNLNGFQLATEVRKHPVWNAIPMVAVSSRARQVDFDAGKKAGFNLYLEKFDPVKLMSSIDQLVKSKSSKAA